MLQGGFKTSSVVAIAVVFLIGGFILGQRFEDAEEWLYERFGHETVNEELPEELDFSKVQELYDKLRSNYAGELDDEALIDGAREGLANAAGDPYTEYLSEEEAAEFENALSGTFSGVGIQVAIKHDRLVVIAPLSGTPADQAGIRAGDFILAINEEDTFDMSIEEAVQRIRGEAGTQVKLFLAREGQDPFELTITRAEIEAPSINARKLDGNVGYIEITRFGPDTTPDFKQAAQDLLNQGATEFIIDLRNNPGGLLQAAEEMSDEFLDNGTIVEIRRGGKTTTSTRANPGGLLVGREVVVLINEGSASASEIMAGALADNDVAKTVGMKTFGKGSVQELIKIGGADDKSLLKVTTHYWFTPAGRNISTEGIAPDIEINRTPEDFNNDKDPQLERAQAELAL